MLEALSSRKVTGNAAIEYLSRLLSCLSEEDAEVLARVIDRDLRCGVQAATVNKIWPGLVYEFPVMLATKLADVDTNSISYPAGVQKKSDGMRIQMVPIHDSGKYQLFTRNGKELSVFNLFDNTVLTGKTPYVFDGEMLVCRDGKILPRTEGNGICTKAIKGKITLAEAQQLVIVLWDAIPLEDWKAGICKIPYWQRYRTLNALKESMDLTKLSVMETTEVHSLEEAQVLFKQARSHGEEGVMLKEWAGAWEAKRVKHQVKFKGIYDADVKIIGWEEGIKKNAGKIGAFIIATHNNELICNVGTGISDEDRERDPSEFVGKIAAIEFNDIVKDRRTGEPKFFLPVLVEVREDKDTADNLEDLLRLVKG